MQSEALTPPPQFLTDANTIGFELTETELHRLGRYLHLLLETNKQFNLTAIREPDLAWRRHILESIAVVPAIGEARSLIDVGAGAGLPGLPIAILCPQLKVTLLEATGKKARFIGSVCGDLGLKNVKIVTDRAETVAHQHEHRERYDLATARAVGPMNVLLELTLPLITPGGRLLAMKGQAAEQELRDAGDALMLLGAGEVQVFELLPGLDDEANLIEVVKESATPNQYPRRPGIPKQDPL
ncbi:16S rRNA (guanine(527)-N(7))-methyltransferase RsmG [Planctomycetales bacterium ZRK34]|nr:16S rRNA (guanine(527)-N(7))-methyltransferase RsmG [Planctomycetales bacterium ZRK34]